MVKNAGSKNKRGRLMKNMKSPNSGLSLDEILVLLYCVSIVSHKPHHGVCAPCGPMTVHYDDLQAQQTKFFHILAITPSATSRADQSTSVTTDVPPPTS